MTIKIRKDKFLFNGYPTLQLFALTYDYRLVYGKIDPSFNKFSVTLEISDICLLKNHDTVINLGKSGHWPVGTPMELLLNEVVNRKEVDNGTFEEYQKICNKKGVDISFYNVVDYMKESKKERQND